MKAATPPPEPVHEIRTGFYCTTHNKGVAELIERIQPVVCKNLEDLGRYDVGLICCAEPSSVVFVSELRKSSDVPLIILGESGIGPKRLREILAAGADDLMRWPMHLDELMARIRAVYRRGQRVGFAEFRTGNIVVIPEAKRVEVDGVPVHLTVKEFKIIEILSFRKGRTLGKNTIFDYLYSGIDEPEFKIVDVFVCKLRRKLKDAGANPHHIQTVWGTGYSLIDEPEQHRQPKLLKARVIDILNGKPKDINTIAHQTDSNYPSVHTTLKRLCAEGLALRNATRPSTYILRPGVTFNGESA